MKASAPLLLVPFREVRHSQPDDCLHYEPVEVRGQLHDWTISAHRHEGLHQFQFLERGATSATIDGRQHEVRAPAIMMIAPGSVHGFRYAPNSFGHQITIPTATLRTILQGVGQLEAELGLSFVLGADEPGQPMSECGSLYESLAQEFQHVWPGRVQALLAQATLIVLWFLRHRGARPVQTRRQPMRDTLVQRLRALSELHYRAHSSLAFYAGCLGVTSDHLSRACRSVTGQSALDLIHARVMLEACRMLAYTTMSVTEIAHDLGYEDPSYFSRFFTRSVGESPTNYRESLHKGVHLSASPKPGGDGRGR